jgi:hypothetical protein
VVGVGFQAVTEPADVHTSEVDVTDERKRVRLA